MESEYEYDDEDIVSGAKIFLTWHIFVGLWVVAACIKYLWS